MSNPLKKVMKGVKKVFKKVVKVVKKVVQSKIFKVVAIAAAVYFTAGAAAGYFGAAGAAGGAATAAGGSALGSAGSIASTGGWAAAETAAVGTVASTVAPVAATTAGLTTGQALLGSAVLTTGGNMASAYAQGKKEEEAIKQIEKNEKHELDVFGIYNASQKKAGLVGTDANGNTEYEQQGQAAPIQQVANQEQSGQKFYNSAQDKWSPVANLADNTKTGSSKKKKEQTA